jgi:hypothetical protein
MVGVGEQPKIRQLEQCRYPNSKHANSSLMSCLKKAGWRITDPTQVVTELLVMELSAREGRLSPVSDCQLDIGTVWRAITKRAQIIF